MPGCGRGRDRNPPARRNVHDNVNNRPLARTRDPRLSPRSRYQHRRGPLGPRSPRRDRPSDVRLCAAERWPAHHALTAAALAGPPLSRGGTLASTTLPRGSSTCSRRGTSSARHRAAVDEQHQGAALEARLHRAARLLDTFLGALAFELGARRARRRLGPSRASRRMGRMTRMGMRSCMPLVLGGAALDSSSPARRAR